MTSQQGLCWLALRTEDDAILFQLIGRMILLGETNTETLAAEILHVAKVEATSELRVDLGNVGLVSTAGLMALLRLRRQLHAAGKRLSLWNLTPAVAEVFDNTRLGRLFDLCTGNLAGTLRVQRVDAEPVHAWN